MSTSLLTFKFIHPIIILLLLFFPFTLLKSISDNEKIMNCYFSKTTGKFSVLESSSLDYNAVASGTFIENEAESGWNFLTIAAYEKDDGRYEDEIKAYAMGYLEGVLTKDKIWDFYPNLLHSSLWDYNYTLPENYIGFLQENLKYMKEKAFNNRHNSTYWYHVHLIYKQMIGLFEGYNDNMPQEKRISLLNFQLFFSLADIEDLVNYKKGKIKITDFSQMSDIEFLDYVHLKTHCSALIKVKDDLSDIFFGHNTWTNYAQMMRIFKEYRFTTKNHSEKSSVVAFPSYPGVLDSNDDFYYMDSKLYVMETTISIYNESIYENMTPYGLMCWVRTILANRLAGNAKEWTEIFGDENTGTYNNQFMVLDLNKVNLDKNIIGDEAFYIIEQIPGYMESRDVTDYLKKGYWPSYNEAFLPKIRELIGAEDILKERPYLFNGTNGYSGCSRAKIFRRDQHNVTDLEGFKHILRYNDYLNDEFSEGRADWQLAARYDLNSGKRQYCYGAIDAKVGSAKELLSGENILHLIAGPTNDQQATFDWGTSDCVKTNPKRWYQGKVIGKWEFGWVDYNLKLFG